ncbi:hypothetical protein NDU88_002580 [Pleurodeles waltl]|uniref:Uncharacterized protein n=1 Tax=Pleurodeles waltl TaxID=8319 RepID=A0AAV7P732_PLEWA|nr:hypothetical protein NDU88_002580 [Pleurodeles waltl]
MLRPPPGPSPVQGSHHLLLHPALSFRLVTGGQQSQAATPTAGMTFVATPIAAAVLCSSPSPTLWPDRADPRLQQL